MGEIAEDMIAGACCSECGMYFTQDHGYPVACGDCYGDSDLQIAVYPLLGEGIDDPPEPGEEAE